MVTGHNITIQEYVDALRPVLVRHFAPGCIYNGRQGALRLGHEVGYGLGAYSDAEIVRVIGSLYSDLLVRNTFNHPGGVPLDMREWNAAIWEGIERFRDDRMWLGTYDTEVNDDEITAGHDEG